MFFSVSKVQVPNLFDFFFGLDLTFDLDFDDVEMPAPMNKGIRHFSFSRPSRRRFIVEPVLKIL